MVLCDVLRNIARTRQPALIEDIRAVEGTFPFSFPSQYVNLLLCSNGFIARQDISSLLIYAIEEVYERNETYEVAIYLPGFIMIGDDGGGRGIFISTQAKDEFVYRFDMGSMLLQDAEVLANTLHDWIKDGIQL